MKNNYNPNLLSAGSKATYTAADLYSAMKNNNHNQATEILSKEDLSSISDLSLTTEFFSNYVEYLTKQERITDIHNHVIAKIITHLFRLSLPNNTCFFKELNILCAKISGNWLIYLSGINNNSKICLLHTALQGATFVDSAILEQALHEIPSYQWSWWALVSLRFLRLGYAQPAYLAKRKAAEKLVESGDGTSSQITAAQYFLNSTPEYHASSIIEKINSPLFSGKRVTVLYSGTPPEETEVAIWINYIPQETTSQYAQVVYCSEDFYKANEPKLNQLRNEEIIQDLILIAPYHQSHRCVSAGPPVFLGYGYAPRKVVADLLHFQPASLKLLGIDFFLNLDDSSAGPNIDHGWSYCLHDPLDMWVYLRNLYTQKQLLVDDRLETILSFQENQFIAQLGRRVAPWIKSKIQNQAYKVISFYTSHNEYKFYADRLKASLERFGIPYEIYPVDLKDSWETVCAYKARFIRDLWEQSRIPVVWLDADATVEHDPLIFSKIDADFAIHKSYGWGFSSGTLFFGKSEATDMLLRQWVIRCEADPFTWDQDHLQSAWCDIAAMGNLRTYWLPQSYLQIFDKLSPEPAVIVHWQASRSQEKIPYLKYTDHGIALRKNEQPWRNAEEAFWITHGASHITPDTGEKFPEGDYVSEVLHQCISEDWPLLEIGCGVGRIASIFDHNDYIGVDINPHALHVARQRLPRHNFRLLDKGRELPEASTALMYTVLLHVSDDEIHDLLAEYTRKYRKFIITEVMDDRWRRPGEPPVFNRDPEAYIFIMQNLGFQLISSHKRPYKRYDTSPWNVGKDSRLTFLIFERKIKKSGKMWIRGEDSFMGDIFSRTGDQFEIEHLKAALNFCHKKRIALDIGAHYGSWSRYMSKEFKKVFSFEPVAATYECCKLNTENFDNIHLYQKAVGAHMGTVSVDQGKFYTHPGMETIIDFDGKTPLITIDSLDLDDVDFIKIDVEGFELAVLQGAEETIKKSKPIIIFEENMRGPLEHNISNGSCANYLTQLGYRLLAVENKDFIFGPIN